MISLDNQSIARDRKSSLKKPTTQGDKKKQSRARGFERRLELNKSIVVTDNDRLNQSAQPKTTAAKSNKHMSTYFMDYQYGKKKQQSGKKTTKNVDRSKSETIKERLDNLALADDNVLEHPIAPPPHKGRRKSYAGARLKPKAREDSLHGFSDESDNSRKR